MVGHEIWREQLKNVQNEKHYKTEKHKHFLMWNMAIHTQKHGKWEMYTVGTAVLREI